MGSGSRVLTGWEIEKRALLLGEKGLVAPAVVTGI